MAKDKKQNTAKEPENDEETKPQAQPEETAEAAEETAEETAGEEAATEAEQPDELETLEISVDILSEAEKIQSTDELDVRRYGVIVSKGFRRGLLLPNLDGVDTVEQQVAIALSKAGISPREKKYEMERFEVIRHEA